MTKIEKRIKLFSRVNYFYVVLIIFYLMKLENLGCIVFSIAVLAVVSALCFWVSWKFFAAFLIVMFWVLINAFLPSGLSNVWYNKRMEQIAAGKTVKCRSKSELEDELGSSATLLSCTVTTLIGGAVLVYIFFFI